MHVTGDANKKACRHSRRQAILAREAGLAAGTQRNAY